VPDRQAVTADPESARVFFALWPDDALRARLDTAAGQLHQVWGGRPTRAASIHLTLAFLGEVPRQRLADLTAVGRTLCSPGFSMRLDEADCWRHNRVAFASASQPPEALVELADALGRELRGVGFRLETRPFKVHVTLLRNARCGQEKPALEPMEWVAREFVLVQSVLGPQGSAYTILERFPLL
jgi:2'-5' RNA ligase